jgi:hypothetical protein
LQLKIAPAALRDSSTPIGLAAGVSTLFSGSGTMKADAKVAPKAKAKVMNLILTGEKGYWCYECRFAVIGMTVS